MSAGADCVRIISGEKTQLTLDELLEMLEPTTERGGAIITPVDDFVSLKNSLEKACILLKDRCTKEIKKKLDDADNNLKELLHVNRNAESNTQDLSRE